jgi:hypothetical protein
MLVCCYVDAAAAVYFGVTALLFFKGGAYPVQVVCRKSEALQTNRFRI